MVAEKLFPEYREMAVSEIFYFDKYALFLRSDDIIQLQIKEGFHGELHDAENVVKCIKLLSNKKKYALLAIYSAFNTFSKKNQEYAAKNIEINAHAIVNDSLATKLLGNFYIKMNKPIVPTKVFSDVDSAIKWLKTVS